MNKDKKIIKDIVVHRPTCDKVRVAQNNKCTCRQKPQNKVKRSYGAS